MLIPKQKASLFHFSFIGSASGLLYEICWFRFHDLSYLPRIYYIRTRKSEQLHGFGTCNWLLHIAFVFSFKYNGTLRKQPVFTARELRCETFAECWIKIPKIQYLMKVNFSAFYFMYFVLCVELMFPNKTTNTSTVVHFALGHELHM